MNSEVLESLLLELLSVHSPSGMERDILDVLEKQFSSEQIVRDGKGNLLVNVKKGTGSRVVIDAHIDKVGFVVTGIEDEGFVKVAPVGGIDPRLMSGTVISFYETGAVGVVSTVPPHISKDESDVKPVTERYIDVGVDAAKKMSLGDRGVFVSSGEKLLSNMVCGSGLDNMAGAASIVMAAKELADIKSDVDITLLFSAQEEVGTIGAITGVFGRAFDMAIIVDVTFGDQPGVDKDKTGKLGDGPMIGISPMLDNDITADIISAAKKGDIKHQIEVMSGRTSTNADVITVSEAGIRVGLVSIPLRNMHSPNEIVDMCDIKTTAQLIVAYISEVK